MATTRTRRRPRSPEAVQKPSGAFHRRVQEVGPEHFGILCFDCAKQRSRYFLANFYGHVLLEPTTLNHSKGDLQACIDRVRQATRQHGLADLVVAIEQTGEYGGNTIGFGSHWRSLR